jgi:hypothetical protein
MHSSRFRSHSFKATPKQNDMLPEGDEKKNMASSFEYLFTSSCQKFMELLASNNRFHSNDKAHFHRCKRGTSIQQQHANLREVYAKRPLSSSFALEKSPGLAAHAL